MKNNMLSAKEYARKIHDDDHASINAFRKINNSFDVAFSKKLNQVGVIYRNKGAIGRGADFGRTFTSRFEMQELLSDLGEALDYVNEIQKELDLKTDAQEHGKKMSEEQLKLAKKADEREAKAPKGKKEGMLVQFYNDAWRLLEEHVTEGLLVRGTSCT